MSEKVSAAETPGVHEIDPAIYRQVLGHFPTGVTVITAFVSDAPVGFAVGSFSSISLDPPLVGFFAGKDSSSWSHIREAGVFCVNILGDDQEVISRKFASKEADKFEGIGWKAASNGAPRIDGTVATIDCTIESILEIGDHDLCVGRVTELSIGNEGSPLVFFRGGYRSLKQ